MVMLVPAMAGAKARGIWAGIVAALVALLLSTGVAHAGRAHIRIGHTLAGKVLTNKAGYVMMIFPKELNSLKLCTATKSCMTDWPPVATTERPVAPYMLGTEPYRGKLLAVPYAGWPLHTYRFNFSAQNSVLDIGIRQF